MSENKDKNNEFENENIVETDEVSTEDSDVKRMKLLQKTVVLTTILSTKKFVMFAVGLRASAVNYLTCLEM